MIRAVAQSVPSSHHLVSITYSHPHIYTLQYITAETEEPTRPPTESTTTIITPPSNGIIAITAAFPHINYLIMLYVYRM